jgi:hypothetical protein
MEYYSGVHEISDNLGIANRNRPGEAVAGKGSFVWAENKRLKVLLADLCERKTLLAD